MARDARLEGMLERYIQGRLAGAAPDPAVLCADTPELVEPLRELVRRFERLDGELSGGLDGAQEGIPLASFPGFRTIERLARGGSSDVYKLEDLTLGRTVAAKVLRPNSPLASTAKDFLREARALALFDDPRIVRLLEFREGDPPWLLLEYVEGFELSEVGPSLELEQRARIVRDVAQALERAHSLGLQHRDLKPSNILLRPDLSPQDPRLRPQLGGARPRPRHRNPRLHGTRTARSGAAHRCSQRRVRSRRRPVRAHMR
jgi:serine/threonine protein kinase